MMARLLAAMPPAARLILLGDKDQLASVEAGAVLGDICALLRAAHRGATHPPGLQAVTGYELPARERGMARLIHCAIASAGYKSWRFHTGSGIGQLAAAVNRLGRGSRVLR